MFFAFWSWVGFEMAPNYGEESRDPKRIVPQAMYVSVVGLGIFYTITSWAALSGYASTAAAAVQAQTDPAGFFLIPAQQFGNQLLRSFMSYLIITGAFACGMAFHNTTARYFYSLGREKVLPSALGRTHVPVPQSAHREAPRRVVICALIVLAFAVFAMTALGDDTTTDRLRPALRADGVHGRRADPVRPGAGLGGRSGTTSGPTTRASTACGITRSPRRSR